MGRVVKTRPMRVAFLTDTSFSRENALKAGQLKKRALRAIQRKFRKMVVEDSDNPDIIYKVYREPGSKSWALRRAVYNA